MSILNICSGCGKYFIPKSEISETCEHCTAYLKKDVFGNRAEAQNTMKHLIGEESKERARERWMSELETKHI